MRTNKIECKGRFSVENLLKVKKTMEPNAKTKIKYSNKENRYIFEKIKN